MRRRPSNWRRLLAVVGAVAIVVAGVQVMANSAGEDATILRLPGATAEPITSGPPGPTGGQTGGDVPNFQPPGMPSANPGYNGGSYPEPGQNGGVDINSPAAQPGEQGAQQPGSQSGRPGDQSPVHGTQPPDYDKPPQESAQQPAHQEPEQPAQQHEPQQRSEDTQQVNQRQQECQDAAAMLGNVPTIIGGGGEGPIWFEPGLNPPTPVPSPPCPQCPPETSQKQPPSNNDVQDQIDDINKRQDELEETNKRLQEENKKQEEELRKREEENQRLRDLQVCSGFDKFVGFSELALGTGGLFTSIAGAPFTGGQSLWGAPPSFLAMADSWKTLSDCNKAK